MNEDGIAQIAAASTSLEAQTHKKKEKRDFPHAHNTKSLQLQLEKKVFKRASLTFSFFLSWWQYRSQGYFHPSDRLSLELGDKGEEEDSD